MKQLLTVPLLSYLVLILFSLYSCYKTQYSVLYTDLEKSDLVMILQLLKEQKIDFQIQKVNSKFTLSVPEPKQYMLRIFLAQKNLPKMKGLILDYSQYGTHNKSLSRLKEKDFHCLEKTNIPLYFHDFLYKRQYTLAIQKHLEIMTQNTAEMVLVMFDPPVAFDLLDNTFKVQVGFKLHKNTNFSNSEIKAIKNFILLNVPCSSEKNIVMRNSNGSELRINPS